MNINDHGEYSLRLAAAKDLDSLVELLRVLFSIETDFEFDEAKQRRGLQLFLQNQGERAIFVVETGGAVVGMCSVQTLISTAEGAPSGWIEDVCVAQAHRGRGLGRALLGAVDAWCLERGMNRIQITCDINNTPAFDFYTRLGWQPTLLRLLRRYP